MIETTELIQSVAILFLAGSMFFGKRPNIEQLVLNSVQEKLNFAQSKVNDTTIESIEEIGKITRKLIDIENARQSLNENNSKISEES